MASFGRLLLQSWVELQRLEEQKAFAIDGDSLRIIQVVSIARSTSNAIVHHSVRESVLRSVKGLEKLLAEGEVIYGVNTGFGGSADTRTDDPATLQISLLQMQQCGVLTNFQVGSICSSTQCMPKSWVKGAMLIRCNSLIRGHSAVRIQIVETIMTLLTNDVTPIVPLRGSISASGDLSPLSYIAGMLVGNPDIHVQYGGGEKERVMTADKALEELGILPMILGPKEGLGLINGTAVSTSVASLALWRANQFAVLSQVCTAIATEVLGGHTESFHSFIAMVRPHPGHVEAAGNILGFLVGSRLAKTSSCISEKVPFEDNSKVLAEVAGNRGLAQDRYALRTAPQWIGAQLEDLLLAQTQVDVELNSTTDNPLIDATPGSTRFFNGGNFQAASITSAMEKARTALQMLGKMMFAQCTEIINPAYNGGLPANLSADDPSLSFTCKGIDINMAAYTSELAYLANPVSTHIQSAEMHNQAINSLALISARKTMEAVDVMAMMCASYLFVLCQALDLRVLTVTFLAEAQTQVQKITCARFKACCYNLDTEDELKDLCQDLWTSITQSWNLGGTNDLRERCEKAVAATAPVLLRGWLGGRFNTDKRDVPQHLITLHWQDEVKAMLEETYTSVRTTMFEHHTRITPEYLGHASRKMYAFVREELGVPMHRGIVDTPTAMNKQNGQGKRKLTIGSWVSIIFEALEDGRLNRPVMECLKENASHTNGR